MKESSPSLEEQKEGMPESAQPHESFEESWRAVVGEKEIPPGISAKAKNEYAVLNRINIMIATGMIGLTFLAATPSKAEAQHIPTMQEKIVDSQRRAAESQGRTQQMEQGFQQENAHWDNVIKQVEKANRDGDKLLGDLDALSKDLKTSGHELDKIKKEREARGKRVEKLIKETHEYNQNLSTFIEALKRGASKEELERLRKNLK